MAIMLLLEEYRLRESSMSSVNDVYNNIIRHPRSSFDRIGKFSFDLIRLTVIISVNQA